MTTATSAPPTPTSPWWHGVTRYQWLVLAIASAGWIFDVFEGQLFVSLRNHTLTALLPGDDQEVARNFYFNLGLATFLLGGALGGVVFGMLADRFGRRRIMAFTILMYSVFTGLTALVQNGWQLTGLRFLVGMGVGGEWAVAAAAVAEVFPERSRPAAAGIFHASSVLGTYLATAAGLFIIALNLENGWRYGFLLGLLPALLVAWIRVSMRDPESWQAAQERAAKDARQRLGSLRDLFALSELRRRTLLATGLAVIGLATFWGAHIRGMDVLRQARASEQEQAGSAAGKAEQENYRMLGMLLVTTGGGLGLLLFAPISQRLGRRPAFMLFHLGGFAFVVVVYLLAQSVLALVLVLPLFGFFTLGMHAGYAIYFPELFSTRLRGTGSGFCFNMARIVAGPVLLGFGWLQGSPFHLTLPQAMLLLGCLFPLGAILIGFAPETRGQPLPE
jgi:MFS family permease